jgi:hypothetical protein
MAPDRAVVASQMALTARTMEPRSARASVKIDRLQNGGPMARRRSTMVHAPRQLEVWCSRTMARSVDGGPSRWRRRRGAQPNPCGTSGG